MVIATISVWCVSSSKDFFHSSANFILLRLFFYFGISLFLLMGRRRRWRLFRDYIWRAKNISWYFSLRANIIFRSWNCKLLIIWAPFCPCGKIIFEKRLLRLLCLLIRTIKLFTAVSFLKTILKEEASSWI